MQVGTCLKRTEVLAVRSADSMRPPRSTRAIAGDVDVSLGMAPLSRGRLTSPLHAFSRNNGASASRAVHSTSKRSLQPSIQFFRDFFHMVQCGSITKRSHPSRLIYFKKSQKQTTFIEGTRAQTGFLPILRTCRTPAISGNPF